jgi:hypothetical protein
MTEIQNRLNNLWSGILESYEFNILKHIIKFKITVIENEKKSKYLIIFNGVSSYHFYNNSKEERFNIIETDEEDYLELTSIQFYPNGIGNIRIKSSKERWIEQYYSNVNFVLEMWNSMLFIEANSIVLNDVEYQIK